MGQFIGPLPAAERSEISVLNDAVQRLVEASTFWIVWIDRLATKQSVFQRVVPHLITGPLSPLWRAPTGTHRIHQGASVASRLLADGQPATRRDSCCWRWFLKSKK
ncbi:MAG TPA: hypothetical protein DCW57_01610 [Planctomycetaceae bacterium]|nr:hypothetical protein [Planctomycetaceae bacterium]